MKIYEYPETNVIVDNEQDSFLLETANGTKRLKAKSLLHALPTINSNNNWGNLSLVSLKRKFFSGKYLGNIASTAHLNAIKSGNFDNLSLGDYWYVNGVCWRIIDFNYFNSFINDSRIRPPHIVVMPDAALYTSAINPTAPTSYPGIGWHNTQLRVSGLTRAIAQAQGVFGVNNIGRVAEYNVSQYKADGTVTYAFDEVNGMLANLPSQIQLFGYVPLQRAYQYDNLHINTHRQFALFKEIPEAIHYSLYGYSSNSKRLGYWTRDPYDYAKYVSVTASILVDNSMTNDSSWGAGVRPYFCVKVN